MYAVVGASRLKPGATPEVSENVRNGRGAAPGFIGGTIAWSADRERGRSMFLFETEEAFTTAMECALGNMPADPPLESESIEVCEVIAHA